MKKIAIIEDDYTISEMYKIRFELEGFQVYIATNGKDGLSLVEKERPDIILLDLMMPDMNGDEMLQAMRKTNWGKTIPVIVLTNVSPDEAPPTLQPLDIHDYIVKANTTPHMVLEKILAALQ